MAASAIKIEANRANAQLSTGPRSESGLCASAQNACKHHLTGGTAFVEGEDREAYEAHVKRYFRQYKPLAQHEIHFVQEMADAKWRLTRARRMECELIEKSIMNPYVQDDERYAIQLQRLTRYISAIERTYEKAYKELRRINDERTRLCGIAYPFDKNLEKEPVQNEPNASPVPAAEPPVQNEPKLPAGFGDLQFMMNEFRKTKR
jgi:hypothetical protein